MSNTGVLLFSCVLCPLMYLMFEFIASDISNSVASQKFKDTAMIVVNIWMMGVVVFGFVCFLLIVVHNRISIRQIKLIKRKLPQNWIDHILANYNGEYPTTVSFMVQISSAKILNKLIHEKDIKQEHTPSLIQAIYESGTIKSDIPNVTQSTKKIKCL